MAKFVTCALALVVLITVCIVAEPAVINKPKEPDDARIPLPPPPKQPDLPTEQFDEDKAVGLNQAIDIFYLPNYRQHTGKKTESNPRNYMDAPKYIWSIKEIEREKHIRGKPEMEQIQEDFRFPNGPHHIEARRKFASNELFELSVDYGRQPTKKIEKKLSIPKRSSVTDSDIDNLEVRYKTMLKDRDVDALEKKQKKFATTPLNIEFFGFGTTATYTVNGGNPFMIRSGKHKLVEQPRSAKPDPAFEDIRQLRQHPNKMKSLSTELVLHSSRGGGGGGGKSQPRTSLRSQIPVSLLPFNQRKLELLQRAHAEYKARERAALAVGADVEAVLDEGEDQPTTLYAIAIFTAMGAGISLLIIGIGLGWYTLSKKAKAASDVGYPAYGVTGPSADSSGDRKLAQSAHMYHYHHQKQQILAMERGGTEDRNGSMSDAESEDDNEEGDYTVYECPGYATTGDMEVKNPLFTDDPTPATPAAAAANAAVATPASADNAAADAADTSPIIILIKDKE